MATEKSKSTRIRGTRVWTEQKQRRGPEKKAVGNRQGTVTEEVKREQKNGEKRKGTGEKK